MNYNRQEFKFLTGPNENIPPYKEGRLTEVTGVLP